MHLILLLSALGADDDFLQRHWSEPTAGDTEGWGPVEATLLPGACGSCHPEQLRDWTGSRHSLAMGAGVVLQLMENPSLEASCRTCHAPLAEQAADAPEPQLLRHSGLSCAACHIRDGEVFGPPPRSAPSEVEPLPHRGFTAEDAYADPRFCGTCHQFKPHQRQLEGVLLQDTLAEWEASPHAARGETCQACHMPDRRHLWRGIHDPETTEEALEFSLQQEGRRAASYTVTSRGVGHRFPTYVTPRVRVILEGHDAAGAVVVADEITIQRSVDLQLRTQHFDTRMEPDSSVSARVEWGRRSGVVALEGRVVVEPDEFYHRFFMATHSERPEIAALLEDARAESAGAYTIGTRTQQTTR